MILQSPWSHGACPGQCHPANTIIGVRLIQGAPNLQPYSTSIYMYTHMNLCKGNMPDLYGKYIKALTPSYQLTPCRLRVSLLHTERPELFARGECRVQP